MTAINQETAAKYVLAIGVRYGSIAVGKYFGAEILSLIQLTFSELHKNNLPEEYFLFALIARVNRKTEEIPKEPEIKIDVSVESILSELADSPEFEADPRAAEIDEFRRRAVLEDFVYYLSKMFFRERSVGDRIVEIVSEIGDPPNPS